MKNDNYGIAIAEVLEYLKGIKKENVDRISPNFMEFLNKNANKEYKPDFDYTKPLKDLELLDTSKAIIAFICYKYWCDDQEKKLEFYEILKNNDKIYKEKIENKTENFFKNNPNHEILDIKVEENEKKNVFTKIKNIITKILKTRRKV